MIRTVGILTHVYVLDLVNFLSSVRKRADPGYYWAGRSILLIIPSESCVSDRRGYQSYTCA